MSDNKKTTNKSVVTSYQPSFTEWFAGIGESAEANEFREEDNKKVERLEVLYQVIGLPYERPEKFTARELVTPSARFQQVLKERPNELCALRLVPLKPDLPKLRNRGQSIRECYEQWFLKQAIDPDAYQVFLCPHADTLLWSSIFVVNDDAIFGELVRGSHAQLTHGDTTSVTYRFRYNFSSWQWSERNDEAEKWARLMVRKLHITDQEKRQQLTSQLNARFSHDFLAGYFETTVWPDEQLYFIDYNRMLARHITTPPPFSSMSEQAGTVTGVSAFSGVVKGSIVIVSENNVGSVHFPEGSVLVCDNTDVRYLPYMQRCSAIVTDRGGILSHAAIVARELKKPCVVGTQRATRTFHDGDTVTVNADKGIVEFVFGAYNAR